MLALQENMVFIIVVYITLKWQAYVYPPMCHHLTSSHIIVMNEITKFISQMCHESQPFV
jgi:hypothetical protein